MQLATYTLGAALVSMCVAMLPNEMAKNEILKKHNDLRRGEDALNMNDLTWNDKLAEMADLWATYCTQAYGLPSNYPSPPYIYGQIGQNIFVEFGNLSYSHAIQEWFDEKNEYNYTANKCNTNCDSYKQVVSAKTKEIGCSVGICPFDRRFFIFLVCNYGPHDINDKERPYLQAMSPKKKIEYQILAKHNELRQNESASKMNNLTWNDELAEMADLWVKSCQWKRGQPANYPSPPYTQIGQNIFAITMQLSNYFSYTEAIQEWFNEKKNYNYDTNECNTVCLHYKQVVWANSKEIGCSYNLCPNFFGHMTAIYFICNYGPAGNIENEKPYLKTSFSKI